MPLYMDIHNLQGATPEDLAKAHAADLETQRKYGVEYRKYWFDPKCGKAFCLFEAPSADAATQVHCEAHGQVAEEDELRERRRVIEVGTRGAAVDRKSTRLNSSHYSRSRMPSSA